MQAQSVELQSLSSMNRVKQFFQPPQQPYEPIDNGTHEDGDSVHESDEGVQEQPFSWVEYFIFLVLGVAMLWAWYENRHVALYILIILGICSLLRHLTSNDGSERVHGY